MRPVGSTRRRPAPPLYRRSRSRLRGVVDPGSRPAAVASGAGDDRHTATSGDGTAVGGVTAGAPSVAKFGCEIDRRRPFMANRSGSREAVTSRRAAGVSAGELGDAFGANGAAAAERGDRGDRCDRGEAGAADA